MAKNKELYLMDKFNAIALERAAVLLSDYEPKIKRGNNAELIAMQVVHTGLGGFPTTIYKVPCNMTAKEVIGIERYFGQEVPQRLPILIPKVEEITGIKGYKGKEGIEVIGRTDFKTFIEAFKLDVGSKLEDSLVQRILQNPLS